MKTAIVIVLGVLVVVLAVPPIVLAPRVYKDYHKKKAFQNTYAILNQKTGKAIRVRDASNDDGAVIVLYNHHNWECMTWQLIQLKGDVFLLKNQYTQKTFQPSGVPEVGVGLGQQTLGGSRLQYWEFVRQPDETYQIRLKDTELYLSASGDADNRLIVLQPKQDSDGQSWKLLKQNPLM